MNKAEHPLESAARFVRENPAAIHCFLYRLVERNQPLLLRTEILDAVKHVCDEETVLCGSPVMTLMQWSQEAALDGAWVYFALRERVARWHFLRIHRDSLDFQIIEAGDFLRFKERLATGEPEDIWTLELDLAPFSREFAKLHEAHSIGRGVEFLNRRLSSKLFEALGEGSNRLLHFLQVHRYRNQQLMLNEVIESVAELRVALRNARNHLRKQPADRPWGEMTAELRALGFEPGWGATAAGARDTMELLLDILEAPSPANLEEFLSRIPMIFSMAILSPHGFFGQTGVLGRPDTGGQVVYILDQVRALEREMRARLSEQGLEIDPRIVVITRLIPQAEGTTCDQRIEPIAGCQSAYILRVPFRNQAGETVPQWISRFHIWPYLEQFAQDAERELLAELGGRPDLIVGNYSDGNLVASLMSQRLGITQCNIAHALEKTKYLYSDLYWQQNEEHYHFSCQFTADLVAMNTADFIITSTYQEIAGTEDSVGQYESYTTFSMPGLYRVIQGTDVYDPKYNIVSPGADPEVYFPYSESERRLGYLRQELEDLVFGDRPPEECRGFFKEPDKPILFTLARLDNIKNITGLVDWYGNSPQLRERANLLVVAGHINPEHSADAEEQGQIRRMHELMDLHGLEGQVRWLGRHLDKTTAGELYRFVADRRGAFVQPALFEAFGLTVIEAMSSGLPTFATCFGGPLEIIEDGVSGFHIDPNHGELAADAITRFFTRCADETGYWEQISRGALARVESHYTWKRYAERMMTLSRIYGFWKFVTDLDRSETRQYLKMFYALQFRTLAKGLAS